MGALRDSRLRRGCPRRSAVRAARRCGRGHLPAVGLPFAAVSLACGIHSDNGTSGAKNAIDFASKVKTVGAPLARIARLQHCAGGDWVTIDHDGGWRTGYHHMVVVTDGAGPGGHRARFDRLRAAVRRQHHRRADPFHPVEPSLDGECRPRRLGGHPRPRARSGNWNGVPYERLSGQVGVVHGDPVDGKVLGGWRFTERRRPVLRNGDQDARRACHQAAWTVPAPGLSDSTAE
jgi:LasA protease